MVLPFGGRHTVDGGGPTTPNTIIRVQGGFRIDPTFSGSKKKKIFLVYPVKIVYVI